MKTALEDWRHCLEGAEQPFIFWTDHKNLEYIRTAKRLNSWQARWLLFVNFTLSLRPGSKANSLSRQFSSEEELPDPELILSPSCLGGQVRWRVQEFARESHLLNPPPDSWSCSDFGGPLWRRTLASLWLPALLALDTRLVISLLLGCYALYPFPVTLVSHCSRLHYRAANHCW